MEYNGQADSDICSQEELPRLFQSTYGSVTSTTVAKKDTYCLHLAHDTTWDSVAVAMSDRSVAVLNGSTLQNLFTFTPHEKSITGLKFSLNNNNLIWTSSNDGLVKLWDARSNRMEKEFVGRSEDSAVTKPINSFDVSGNEKILCAGTELVQNGAYLLFWDIRGGEILGGYWESHTDDITQVKFHPSQPDTMATASTDGLINVYDVSQNSEDDALTYCMNASVTIDKLAWMSQNGRCERLAGITDIHSLQYWDIKEASPLHKFSREEMTAAMKRKLHEECYLVSVDMPCIGEDPVILAGSGLENEASGCLRLLKLDLQSGRLQPYGMLVSKQKQLMTRAALYNKGTDSYITAGECGVVRVWKRDEKDVVRKETKAKHQKHKAKPY